MLLHAAATARPSAELVARSFGDRERVLAALQVALREGVVEFDDARLRFAYPLLASVCYEQANGVEAPLRPPGAGGCGQ